MRVLHIVPSVSLIHGGPSSAIFGITKALTNQGVSVEIATTNDNGDKNIDVPLRKFYIYREVKCIFFNSLPFFRQYAFSSDMAQWLWCNIGNYDLLHIHSIFSYSSTVAMAIARCQNVPYLIRPLGQLCKWSLDQSKNQKRLYLSLIGYKSINRAKGIHFTALQEKREVEVLNLMPTPFVIPLGVDFSEALPDDSAKLREWLKIPERIPILLFLSRIHPKKGLDHLIPALAKISEKLPFRLVIAGDGKAEDVDQLAKLLSNCSLSKQTHLLGFVEGKQKDILLQGSDLFMLTSHSENFGVAVIEAMNASLPVLITPGVALSKIVQDYDLGYVPELNHESILDNILRFLENPLQGKEKGQRGKQFARANYDWNIIAKKTIEVYSDILKL